MTTQTVAASLKVTRELRIGGRILTLRTARKDHKCDGCGMLIEAGTDHAVINIGGAGLYNLKFPGRKHLECL